MNPKEINWHSKDQSRGISGDMSSEAMAKRLEIACMLRTTAFKLARAAGYDPFEEERKIFNLPPINYKKDKPS